MADNTAMRLLAIFLFCSCFSVNAAYDVRYSDVKTDEDSDISLNQNEPLDVTDVTSIESESTEEVAAPEAETVTADEPKQEVSKSTARKARVRSTSTKKNVTKASRKSGKKVTTGRARKEATPTGAKPGASSKKIRKARSRGIKSEITLMAEFEADGNLDSFNEKADKLVAFIQSKKMLTAQQRTDLYSALVKFKFILGREGFTEDEHYDASSKVFEAATKNPKLFSSYQLKRINDWKSSIETEKNSPELRKTSTVPTAARRKQPRKGQIDRSKGTPTKKSAARRRN